MYIPIFYGLKFTFIYLPSLLYDLIETTKDTDI